MTDTIDDVAPEPVEQEPVEPAIDEQGVAEQLVTQAWRRSPATPRRRRPRRNWPRSPQSSKIGWVSDSAPGQVAAELLHQPVCDGPGITMTHVAAGYEKRMATEKQRRAAKKNVRKAAKAAREQKTIANMPKKTRIALGKQGAAVAKRQREGGSRPKTRQELYEEAKRRDLPGRSKMGRAELAKALGET